MTWTAGRDGGETYEFLESDDDGDSSEAVNEAAERFGMATNEWEVLEEPIASLTPVRS